MWLKSEHVTFRRILFVFLTLGVFIVSFVAWRNAQSFFHRNTNQATIDILTGWRWKTVFATDVTCSYGSDDRHLSISGSSHGYDFSFTAEPVCRGLCKMSLSTTAYLVLPDGESFWQSAPLHFQKTFNAGSVTEVLFGDRHANARALIHANFYCRTWVKQN
jgi:hypothetical protein